MKVLEKIISKKKNLAILIDPDKQHSKEVLVPLIEKLNFLNPDFIFVGGSTVDNDHFNDAIQIIKSLAEIPLVIFPGSHHQISDQADAILFLSLISGRNPDYLIGHHIEAAHHLKKMKMEVLPTGYLLIDGGKNSSVQYVSQTTPIPQDQISIAVKTAIAGELLGMSCIFLDAGSGALNTVPERMIKAVKDSIEIPLIIGGGIRNIDQIEKAFHAGANIVVVGNKIEEDVNFLLELISLKKTLNEV